MSNKMSKMNIKQFNKIRVTEGNYKGNVGKVSLIKHFYNNGSMHERDLVYVMFEGLDKAIAFNRNQLERRK